MTLSAAELLRKATMTTGDLGGSNAPLTIEQVEVFLRLAIQEQVMLKDVRTVMANAAKWQESKINFDARILHPGTQGQRLVTGDQTKPGTGVVEISTVLLRGEVPISDEVMEDQVEKAGFGDTIMAMVAEASGRDIEELFIRGDTGNGGDPYLALADGWLVQAQGSGANIYDATADGQDFQHVYRSLLNSLPDRYKRDLANMRYYVPKRLEERYRDILASRGTPLGDMMLMGGQQLTYQTIPVVGVPLFPIATGSPDTSFVLLTHRMNLYAGYRREVRLETWRDPREGATSFIVSCRVEPKIAHVPACAIAVNVDVSIS